MIAPTELELNQRSSAKNQAPRLEWDRIPADPFPRRRGQLPPIAAGTDGIQRYVRYCCEGSVVVQHIE